MPEPSKAATAIPHPHLWGQRFMRYAYEPFIVHGTYWAWWRCSKRSIARLYRDNLADTHLELAPGTGYFLRRLGFGGSQLHLLDLHDAPLNVSARRLDRFEPECHHGDVLRPLPLPENSVGSVAAGMLVHCLPGENIAAKAHMFDHVASVLTTGGRFFGTTVLGCGEEIRVGRLGGRWGLRKLNEKGWLHNLGDERADLEHELKQRFDDVTIRVEGAVALFQATRP